MAETRTYNGFTYERQADGSWRKAGPAGPQMPADPTFPYQGAKAQADVQNTQANAAGQAIDNRVASATAPAVIRKAAADAAKAEADAQTAMAEASAKPDPAQAAQTRNLQLDEVLKAIDNARGRTSGWSTGLAGQVLQPIGGTDARDLSGDLSTIASALTVDKLQQMKAQSATGASGMGALSEKEGALLRDSVASLDQAQSTDKVKESLDAIELHYRRLQAIQAGQNPDEENVQRAFGIVTPGMKAPAVGGNDGGPGMTLATGGSKMEFDPTRAGLNAKVAEMVRSGSSADQIRAFLASAGVTDPVTGIDEAVDFRRKYPSYKGDYQVDVETKNVPLGTIGSAVNSLGQSGIGSYFLNAADALTAGTLDNMTSNPVATRAAMDAISNEHQLPAILGIATGGALGAAGLEAGAGAMGLKALPAMMASDAAYGAAYGAGSADDGDRLMGAVQGAAIGTAGGALGRGATKAAGGLVRGVTDPYKRLLNERGVRMSIPQMAGGALKGVEDRIAGLPVVGGIVNGTRKAGLDDWRRAAFNEGLAPIGQSIAGETGEQAIQNAQDAVSQAYRNTLGGVRVQADQPFKQAVGNVAQQVSGAPRVGPELYAAMDATASPMFGPGGTLTGESAQDILQGMEQIKRGYRGNAFTPADPLYATHIAPAVDGYTGAVNDLLGRQAPGVSEGLKAANKANSNVSALGDAVMAAQGRMNGDFTPAQLMGAVKTNTKAFSGKRAAAAGRGGLFGIARAGNKVLPNEVPDSGTAGRLAMYGLLGGTYGASDYSADGENASLGSSATKALAAASALALAGKGARPLVQKVAFNGRGKTTIDLGEFLLRNPQLGGGAAIPFLLPQN